jgi:two-component system LytT family response regulator
MNRKLKALIVDDEPPARQIIRAYLNKNAAIEVVGECDNGFDALKSIQELRPDILFLDIQMPKITGLELVEVLEQPPHIVFITAYDEFAIKAFELNAVDYLLKPFSEKRFNAAVEKVLKQQETGVQVDLSTMGNVQIQPDANIDRIVVKKGSQLHVLSLDEVLFVEAQDDYVMIHTSSGRFLKSKTMKYYESQLPAQEFVRIHRSYIVNVSKIQSLEPYDKETYLAIISQEHKLKISRNGYRKLKEHLNF